MNILIGADHAGYELKQELIGLVDKLGHNVHEAQEKAEAFLVASSAAKSDMCAASIK